MKQHSFHLVIKPLAGNTFLNLLLAIMLFTCKPVFASGPLSGIRVTVDKQTGNYSITTQNPHWTFSGSIGMPLAALRSTQGKDAIGRYRQVSFAWKADHFYTGSIRYYQDLPVVFFSLDVPRGAQQVKAVFPAFTTFPDSLHPFSFAGDVFAPHQFKLNRTSTPWLFFNDRADAFILSPASDFMVAKMLGDGKTSIASGLNPALRNLPENFSHKSILVVGKGIGASWDTWGNALMKLYGKKRPANDCDAVLKYYGYWTDNGADYYYNYDTTKGYANTLLALRRRYRQEGIPLGYLQLDSWWYDKSIYDPDGKPDAGHKNKKLPDQPWNRYGGITEYTADTFLFPHGLAYFHREAGLPFVVHSRWIDPRSPYHTKYKITGYAAVDPAYWKNIAAYLKSSGVVCYEQDWLNYIYSKTPDMASDLSTGNAFTGDMAAAFKAAGIDMQYCMPLPCFYLQGLHYDNLTTIRPSDDRFEPRKWENFIYDSQFAYAVGSWPWCDVFKSHETGNMILAVLSAGAVGTGDFMGGEDKHNILMACRSDGVLVKPDAAAVPMDQTYIHDAVHSNAPELAWTYTKQHGIETAYVFAFDNKNHTSRKVSFSPAALGMKGEVLVYDPLTASAKKLAATDMFTALIGKDAYDYYIAAPFTSSGIALLGDENKIVSTGTQRIADMQSTVKRLTVKVLFAPQEKKVTLQGYYEKPFSASKGTLSLDAATRHFTLELSGPSNGGSETVNLVVK